MALVANYSSSEASDSDEAEEPRPGLPASAAAEAISDEEDEVYPHHTSEVFEADDEDIPGLSTAGASSLFGSLAPATQSRTGLKGDFVDRDEDLSALPQPHAAERELVPLKPRPRAKVRIMVPALAPEEPAETADRPRRVMAGPSRVQTGLLNLLPQPQHAQPTSFQPAKKTLMPDSVRKRASQAPTRPTVRPKVVKIAATTQEEEDSDDDEDGVTGGFFTLEADKISDEAARAAVSASLPALHHTIKANPTALAPSDRPLEFSSGPSRSVLPESMEIEAPNVGPSRPIYPVNAYPEADDLMANTQALERLAGKHAIKNSTGIDIVDVDAGALAGDPREWIVKALTEDDSDKPGPKNNVKGQTKRKHQITYLAAMAKENEHKLKAQWANSAANKRAAGAKYGFF